MHCGRSLIDRDIKNLREGYRKYCCPKCAKDSDERKALFEKTCLKRYGVKNPSESGYFKEKKKKTCLANFGVDNPARSKIVADKIADTNIRRYGCPCALHSLECAAKTTATIKKRYPYCEVLIFSTLVQGDQAAAQIVRQIKHAQEFDIDTLIVGRGGGSIEDLWPFNEEIVARTIYDCKIPVISAVGHEIDWTISDYVADKRAPTPTGAAMIAVPDTNEVKFKITQLNGRLNKNMKDMISQNKTKLNHISQKQILKNPESIYEIKAMILDNLVTKLELASKKNITENKNRLLKLENRNILRNPDEILRMKRDPYLRNLDKLNVLNPLLTLKRGYTLTKLEGKVVSSAKEVKSGDKLDVEFDDGVINTRVI